MSTPRVARVLRGTVWTGAFLATAGTLHELVNLRRLRAPATDPPPVREPVSVLVPARDEAHRVGPTICSLLAQSGVPDLEVIVLDDGSADDTAGAVTRAAAGDPRLRVLTGTPPPVGFLGKPHACAQLAAAARGRVLVFVDADVVLAPHAVAAAVALLRDGGFGLLCPWPRQLADDLATRLVQPLLAWSWLVTLPLGVAERSRRPSLVAANGQFLLVDAAVLATAGGFAAVSGEVLDDIALARAVRRTGSRTGVADGSGIAACRMYEGGTAMAAGYRKSLWRAFGGPGGSAAVAALLALAYVVPAVAASAGSRAGLVGYGAAVVGRALAAYRTGGRVWPDSAAHPVSVAALLGLLASSWAGHRAGTLRWKGRPL
ncbi:MAG: glycosyltransferase family 2 protein [Pseudonocardia sp.]|nr:glycosyltransferase family 2 protein [Pseudonocardia sp.]